MAEDVWLEALVPHAVACEEGTVVQSFDNHDVGEGEHDGDVSARSELIPGGVDRIWEVIADGAEEGILDPALGGGVEVLTHDVPTDAAGADGGILERDTTKGDDQVRMGGDHRPRGGTAEEGAHVADNAVEDDFAGGVAVGIDGGNVAADAVEETVKLALGVVKAARTRPAVGAPVDGPRAVRTVDSPQLGGQQLRRRFPIDRHERFRPAPFVRSGTTIEPAGADRRPSDPGAAANAVRDVAEQGRRIGVQLVRAGADDGAVLDDGVERAPMG